VYWHAQQIDEAKELFLACADTPDFAPFYAARANLIAGNQLTDLKKAASMNANEWRYGKLLINYYLENKNTSEAVSTAKQYSKRLPKNYLISMLLAKALLFDGQFEASGKILANTKILPYEGATESRLLYREAWLMQAVEDIGKGKYNSAMSKIETARRWPENLGVGKPYPEDINDRLENYMESLCFQGMKNGKDAAAKWNEIIQMNATKDFSNFITAEVYKEMGKLEEGEVLMNRWRESDPENELVNWSRNAYEGKIDQGFSVDNPDFKIMKAILTLNKNNGL
jgi:predicted Zn-dependent protease